MTALAGILTCSAQVPPKGKATRVPTAGESTPSPCAITRPAPSIPVQHGYCALKT